MLELKVLKTLLPQNARAWFVREGYILDLFTGVAKSFEDFREWLESVKDESFPSQADVSLKDWYKDYGILYTEADSKEYKRQKLMAKMYQVGAMNKTYVLSVIKKLGLNDINIIEGVFGDEDSCGDENAQCGVCECGNYFSIYSIYDTFYGYYFISGTISATSIDEYNSKLNTLKDTLNEIVRCTLEPIYEVSQA